MDEAVVLHGRVSELAQLNGLTAAAAGGEPFVALVEGDPGIGKSRLLDEALAGASLHHLETLRANAYELERDRPFGPLAEALGLRADAADPARAALGAALTAGGPAGVGPGGAEMHGIAEGIIDLLQSYTRDRPMLLAVEDLHWADPGTLVTLGRIARMAAHLSVSVICTTRQRVGTPETEALLRALDAAGATRLVLGRLDDGAVRQLAAELLGAAPGPNLLARLEGAAGNPLYVVEVVAALQDEGLVTVSGGGAEVEGTDLPPALRLTILRRLGFLPARTLELLSVAAVLGSASSMVELSAATGRPASELLVELRPALGTGLVAARGDALRFQHDLVRDAVYSDLPEAARAGIHLEVARALAHARLPATRVARHFQLGISAADTEASDWLWRAAEELEQIDPPGALSLASAALERTPLDHPDRDERRAVEAAMRLLAGDPLGEAGLLALVEEDVAEELRWFLEGHLVHRYVTTGRLADAERIANARRRALPAQAVIAGRVAGARIAVGNLAGALELVDDLPAAGVSGHEREAAFCRLWWRATVEADAVTELQGLSIRALVAWLQGRGADAVPVALRAEDVLWRSGRRPQPAHAINIFVFANAGMHAAWRETARRVASATISHMHPEIDTAIGMACWLSGDWDAAMANFETSITRGDEAHDPWIDQTTCAVAAAIALHRDDWPAAHRWLALAEGAGIGFGFSLATWTRALVAEAEGRPADALAQLGQAWQLETGFVMRGFQRYYAADLVRLALLNGDRAQATAVVTGVSELCQSDRSDGTTAVYQRCRGLLAEDPDLLLASAESYGRAGSPVERARVLEQAAVLLGPDRKLEARALLDEGIAAYERVEALRDRTRAIRRLRDLGVHRRARRTPRPTTGWESLSDAERRVVQLVADGLTYREIGERLFISRRTVETHVSHVFTKLDLRSRAELTAAYAKIRS